MKQRLNIMQLCASFSMGGAERLLLGLGEHFDRTQFEMHMCGLRVVRGNALQPAFEQLGVPCYVVDSTHFYDWKAVAAVMRYVRDHDIDLIHTHLAEADIVGRIVGRMLRRPVISTLQNEPRDYNRLRFDRRYLERFTVRRHTAHVVAVSQRIREMFIQEWHIPPTHISTIHNAVSMEHLLSIAPGTHNAAAPVITTVGRLSPQKSQHLLLEAAKHVLSQHPNAHFMIVGQGRLEQELKNQAHALGIAERVTFTGVRHDVPDILAQTDIFVLPSLWEGLPLTAVEAMAAARPVVLTDVGGNRELVESGRNGLIVPPGSVAALAEALMTMLDDSSLRLRMGTAARAHVRDEFNIAHTARQYEALYQSVYAANLLNKYVLPVGR